LIIFLANRYPIGYIPHIANDDLFCLLFFGKLDNRATDFMADIALFSFSLAPDPVFGLLEFFPAPGTTLTATLQGEISARLLLRPWMVLRSSRAEKTTASLSLLAAAGWISPISPATSRCPGGRGGSSASSPTIVPIIGFGLVVVHQSCLNDRNLM
jgi:hypothetical protein